MLRLAIHTNLLYFIIVSKLKILRKISLFTTHHVNLIGLVQSILVSSWSFNSYPIFQNEYSNKMLCFISEMLWTSLKYTRAYSILILALYRYLSVFNKKYFKKISNSIKFTILTGLLPRLISFWNIFYFKIFNWNYTFGFMCLDGNSNIVSM